MKLIITRHGETEENKNRIVQGHLPGRLSEKGKEQSKRLAERLKDEKIDAIFSSDLARASDTAKEIAKFHLDVPLKFVKELRERDMGDFQGKKTIPNWKEEKWNPEIFEKKRVEGLDKMLERAKDFLEVVLKEFHGKTILFVAHNGINQTIVTSIFGKSWEEIRNVEKQGNTGITIFEFDKNKKPKLVLMNCIKHLDNFNENHTQDKVE